MRSTPPGRQIREFRDTWTALELGDTITELIDPQLEAIDYLRTHFGSVGHNWVAGGDPNNNPITRAMWDHWMDTGDGEPKLVAGRDIRAAKRALVADLRTDHHDTITSAIEARRDAILDAVHNLAPTLADINDDNEGELADLDADHATLATCAHRAHQLRISTAAVHRSSGDWDRLTAAQRIVKIAEHDT